MTGTPPLLPPGDYRDKSFKSYYRDLGTGRGPQRGGGGTQSWETAIDVGTRRRDQRRAAEADGWQVRAASKWAALCARRGGGEREQT